MEKPNLKTFESIDSFKENELKEIESTMHSLVAFPSVVSVKNNKTLVIKSIQSQDPFYSTMIPSQMWDYSSQKMSSFGSPKTELNQEFKQSTYDSGMTPIYDGEKLDSEKLPSHQTEDKDKLKEDSNNIHLNDLKAEFTSFHSRNSSKKGFQPHFSRIQNNTNSLQQTLNADSRNFRIIKASSAHSKRKNITNPVLSIFKNLGERNETKSLTQNKLGTLPSIPSHSNAFGYEIQSNSLFYLTYFFRWRASCLRKPCKNVHRRKNQLRNQN